MDSCRPHPLSAVQLDPRIDVRVSDAEVIDWGDTERIAVFIEDSTGAKWERAWNGSLWTWTNMQ